MESGRRVKGVKKGGADYSGGEWFGKDKILVEKSGIDGSDFCIVDLRRNVANTVGGMLLNRDGDEGGLTAVENTIYAIGVAQKDPKSVNIEKPREEDLVHTGASMLELRSSPCRWKHLHGGRMIDPDRFKGKGSIVSMGDNIFSFGGTRELCEFYHTAASKKKRRWRPLPRPPHDHRVLIPVVTDPLNDRFLCFFPKINSLYACYPYKHGNPWVCLHYNVPKFRAKPFPTVVNDVIYFFWDDLFEAYDIRTNEKLQLIWSSYFPFGPRDIFRYTFYNLLHLGDDILCLATSFPGKLEDPARTKRTAIFVFYRFRVCRTSPLTATFTPLTVHRIPAPGYIDSINFLPL